MVFGIDRLIDTLDRRSARRLEGSVKVYMTWGIPVNEQRTRIPGRFTMLFISVFTGNSASTLRFHVFSYTYSFSSRAGCIPSSLLAKRSSSSPTAPIDYRQLDSSATRLVIARVVLTTKLPRSYYFFLFSPIHAVSRVYSWQKNSLINYLWAGNA